MKKSIVSVLLFCTVLIFAGCRHKNAGIDKAEVPVFTEQVTSVSTPVPESLTVTSLYVSTAETTAVISTADTQPQETASEKKKVSASPEKAVRNNAYAESSSGGSSAPADSKDSAVQTSVSETTAAETTSVSESLITDAEIELPVVPFDDFTVNGK